jgi:hypothetical protein
MTEEQQKDYYDRVTEEREAKKRGRPLGSGNKKEESGDNLVEKVEEGWEFSGVLPTIRNGKIKKYNLSLSAGLIASLFEQGKIIYDSEYQRGEKELKTGKIVPICKMSKINEILQGMQEDNIYGGTIVLNSPISPDNEIEYDLETGIIKGTSVLSVVDGQHRLRGCAKWLKLYNKGKCINSPFDWEYPVTIENVSRIESGNIFSEYAGKTTLINKTRIEALNTRDLSNLVIRNLITNSKLLGKVDMTSISPRNNKIITFGYLAEGVNTFFKPLSEEQCDSIANYLIDMFNKLFTVFLDQMGNISFEEKAQNRKKYLTIEKMAWISYFALFKELAGREDVEEMLRKLRSKIRINNWEGTILDRDCIVWQNTIMRQGNKVVSTKSTQKIMSKIIVDFVINNAIEGFEYQTIG